VSTTEVSTSDLPVASPTSLSDLHFLHPSLHTFLQSGLPPAQPTIQVVIQQEVALNFFSAGVRPAGPVLLPAGPVLLPEGPVLLLEGPVLLPVSVGGVTPIGRVILPMVPFMGSGGRVTGFGFGLGFGLTTGLGLGLGLLGLLFGFLLLGLGLGLGRLRLSDKRSSSSSNRLVSSTSFSSSSWMAKLSELLFGSGIAKATTKRANAQITKTCSLILM